MRRFSKLCTLILVIYQLTFSALAQVRGLPPLKKGQSYRSVRVKMTKANWKPFHSPDADECSGGDLRCAGRPEMQSCAGTGLAPCRFLWKRKGTTVIIFTLGENTIYNGYELAK